MKVQFSAALRIFLVLGFLLPMVGSGSVFQGASAAPEVGYSISGKVTDSAGNPVPNVTIQACNLSKQPVLLIHGWGGGDVLSENEDGFAQLYQTN